MKAMTNAVCGLCGEPMPSGEEMFNYHGYSGPCPKPPLPKEPPIDWKARAETAGSRVKALEEALSEARVVLAFYACPVGNDVDGSPIRVPDFYDELEFGAGAKESLSRIRAALTPSDQVER